MQFDAIDYFDDAGIDYRSEGNNVAVNDINIDCPFCGETKKHLAVNKYNGKINCWACNLEGYSTRPGIIDLIKELESCSFAQALSLFKQHQTKDFDLNPVEESEIILKNKIDFPPYTYDFSLGKNSKEQSRAMVYLFSRGFGWRTVKKYKLKYCEKNTKERPFFGHRIIIPLYFQGEVVNYIGRDYTGKSPLRYKNCKITDVVRRPKDMLYNYDSVKSSGNKHIYIVEGVPNVWRMDNDSTLGLMTDKMSREQRSQILDLKPKSLTFMLDYGTYARVIDQIAAAFAPIVEYIKIINFPNKKDVADYRLNEILKMEQQTKVIKF